MSSNPSRLALLRSVGQKLGLTAANLGFMPVSAAEVAETVQSVIRHEQPHSILDEEIEGATPRLDRVFAQILEEQANEEAAKRAKQRERTAMEPLAASERTRLQRDVDAYRWKQGKARNQWIVPISA